MKAMKFIPVLLVVFFILVTFTIPVEVLSADCPCFTAEDVIRYASHPSKFTCIGGDYETGLRVLKRGKYAAWFGISYDEYGGWTEYYCSAYVYVGDMLDPDVVLFGSIEPSDNIPHEDWKACIELLSIGDPQDCTCQLVEELCD